MTNLILAFIAGAIFATIIALIILYTGRMGVLYYDDHQLLLGLDSEKEWERLHKRKYIFVRCSRVANTQEFVLGPIMTHSEVEDEE